MSLYPDNVNRANRVMQLAGDISRIQVKIKEQIDDATALNTKAIKVLNEVSNKAGYKTLDEYEAAAFKLLSAEQRASLEGMKKDIQNFDSDMSISHTVFRGMIAIGLLFSGTKFTALGFELETTQRLVFGLQAILRGLYKALTGTVEAAVNLFTWGRVTLDLVSKMPAVLNDGVRAVEIAKKGGNILLALGVVADGVLLVTEAIKGAQQRKNLQEAIKMLCYHRFIAKQLEIESKIILDYESDLQSFCQMTEKHQTWVAAGKETKEEAGIEIAEMLDLSGKLKKKLSGATPQETWDLLNKQDQDVGTSWKDEDATFSEIMAYVATHPELSGKDGANRA